MRMPHLMWLEKEPPTAQQSLLRMESTTLPACRVGLATFRRGAQAARRLRIVTGSSKACGR